MDGSRHYDHGTWWFHLRPSNQAHRIMITCLSPFGRSSFVSIKMERTLPYRDPGHSFGLTLPKKFKIRYPSVHSLILHTPTQTLPYNMQNRRIFGYDTLEQHQVRPDLKELVSIFFFLSFFVQNLFGFWILTVFPYAMRRNVIFGHNFLKISNTSGRICLHHCLHLELGMWC